MSDSDVSEALNRWAACLAPENFRYEDESTVERSREGLRKTISAYLRPQTVEQVQEILRIAQDTKQAVYTISTGQNIGMGSHLPVTDGCAILDLSGLNRIREISAEGHYAVVEPGVTQGALFDEIVKRELPLHLNVTGAARETSLIGNCLERGIGYFHERGTALAGLEVVLPNGEIFRTGFAAYEDASCASVYSPGNGPDVGALFSQSNFGVVTAAGFKLMPRPEAQAVLLMSTRSGIELEAFLAVCIQLRQQDVINTILHFANQERSRISLEPLLFKEWRSENPLEDEELLKRRIHTWLNKQPYAEWNAVCGLRGSADRVKSALREIKKRMKPYATVRCFTPESLAKAEGALTRLSWIPPVLHKLHFVRAVTPLLSLAFGEPTDAPQQALDMKGPDGQERGGVLYTLPIYPCIAPECLSALKRLEALGSSLGFPVSVTLNLIDEHTIEGVVSIAFNKESEEESKNAQACIYAMEELSIKDGYPPYRTGIDRMDLADPRDDVRRWVLNRLKLAFDPERILSPGRYVSDERCK